MPYIYKDVEKLQDEDKVGSEQCVALVQHYAGAPNTGSWKEGKGVLGEGTIAKGTAIATFVGGRYESKSHGNHAALFISADANGIWVMDRSVLRDRMKTTLGLAGGAFWQGSCWARSVSWERSVRCTATQRPVH